MSKIKFISFVAAIALALALTFGCSTSTLFPLNYSSSANNTGSSSSLSLPTPSSSSLALSSSSVNSSSGSVVSSPSSNVAKSSSSTAASQQGSSPSSSVAKSSSSTATSQQGRCKDSSGKDYYCQWTSGCYAIDPRYAETAGQSCSALVEECQNYGQLFSGTFTEGDGLKCNASGGNSSSSSASDPFANSTYKLTVIQKPYLGSNAITFQGYPGDQISSTGWNTSTGKIEMVFRAGVTVNLIANAVTGYKFDGWTGDEQSTSERLQVKSYTDVTLTANFVSNGNSSSSAPVPSNCSLNGSTFKIGTQTWMKENLNCNVSGSKCYDNDPASCENYGRLYDWATAMALPSSCNSTNCASQISAKHRGICPSGWHIPSVADWNLITNGTFAGEALKAIGADNKTDWWYWDGTNSSGFTALPGGYCQPDGNCYGANIGLPYGYGGQGLWWSAEQFGPNDSYNLFLKYRAPSADMNYGSKGRLLSVRCLQD